MSPVRRYAVTLPGTPGAHAPPRVVIVHLTDTTGPDGRAVYADEAGDLLVHVSACGIAEPLEGRGCPSRMPCLHAVPMP